MVIINLYQLHALESRLSAPLLPNVGTCRQLPQGQTPNPAEPYRHPSLDGLHPLQPTPSVYLNMDNHRVMQCKGNRSSNQQFQQWHKICQYLRSESSNTKSEVPRVFWIPLTKKTMILFWATKNTLCSVISLKIRRLPVVLRSQPAVCPVCPSGLEPCNSNVPSSICQALMDLETKLIETEGSETWTYSIYFNLLTCCATQPFAGLYLV